MTDGFEIIRGEAVSVRIRGDAFWGIVELARATGGRVTVVGKWPSVTVGDSLEVEGCWSDHPRFGRQFRARRVEVIVPQDQSGAIAWLTGRCPHLGQARATALVERFGVPAVWDVIERRPHELVEIPGITPERRDAIVQAYLEHRAERDRMVRLKQWGLTDYQIGRVLVVWGERAETVLEEDPYRLCDEVHGFGFKRADHVARRMGLPLDAAPRLRAGILWVLGEGASAGHAYLPHGKLVSMAARVLEVDELLVRRELEQVEDGGRIVRRAQVRLYQPALDRAEAEVAASVAALLRAPGKEASDAG